MGAGAKRIPSLDGLRAASIALVLYGHLLGTRGFFPIELVRWSGDVAHLGVIVFFVISGFLITSLLMTEREQTGKVSLKRFYLRRVLRIFPAFYVFVAAMIVAAALGWIDLHGSDLAFALTYTANYAPERSWYIGHLWSLSIEEQFYLIWPLLFVALSARGAFVAALVAFLAGPAVRTGMHLLFAPPSPWRDLEIFPALADNIAIGCLLALLRPWLITRPLYLRVTASPWLSLLVPLILVINRLTSYTLVDMIGSPLMLIAIAVLVEASTRQALTPVGRVLNSRPFVFVGTLSYSLYLWQQPFIDRHSEAAVASFPLNIALAFVAALLSYFVVERAFLGMRRRLERVTTLPTRPEPLAAPER